MFWGIGEGERNMTTRILFIVLMLSVSFCTVAQVYVKGYSRKDGTYVQPHVRSSPDKSVYNNWSTKGNVNPYTGKEGSKDVYNNYAVSPPVVYDDKSLSNGNIALDNKNGFKHFVLGDDIGLDKYADKVERISVDGIVSKFFYTGSDVNSVFGEKITSIVLSFNINKLYNIRVDFEGSSYLALSLGLKDVFGYPDNQKDEKK